MVAGVSVSRKSIAAEAMLAGTSWRSVGWRRGTKGRPSARFAAVRVRVADGPHIAFATWVASICPETKPG